MAVREKIREALEVGVRRMNLNAAAGSVGGNNRKEPTVDGDDAPRREPGAADLDTRIKKLDRLQFQIEQSFRSVKKELLKGSNQGNSIWQKKVF